MTSDISAPSRINRSVSTAGQLYSILRKRIVDLELEPGSVLSRKELSLEYGVSPMPLREAMARLSEEGLLDIHPQSKTMVAPIDVENARKIHFLRTSVEMEVARVLAERGTDISSANALLDQQAEALKENDIFAFSDLDRQFHRKLHREAGFEELWDLVIARSGHIDRIRRMNLPVSGRAPEFLEDHKVMLNAIQSGSADLARQSVRDHLDKTLMFAENARDVRPGFFA